MPDEDHIIHPNALGVGDRGPHRADHLLVGRGAMVPRHFCDHHDMLAPEHPRAECCNRSCPNGRMGMFRCSFDILRVEIVAAHYHEVLEPTSHHQVAAMNGAEVARAKVGCVVAREPGAEEGGGFLLAPPVSSRHASTRNPDFAHCGCGAFDAGFRMHYADIQ